MPWRKKNKAFSVPLKKKITKIDKDGNESVETISYKIPFIDSMKFMTTSLSKLVDNLTEGIHVTKCKDCDFFLNMKVSRMIWWNVNAYLAMKIIETRLMEH